MRREFENIDFLVGNAEILERMPFLPAKKPFSEDTEDMLDALSASIRKLPNLRDIPSSAAFALWCRRSGVNELKKAYSVHDRLGRGVTLHFAPSNIPVLFAFSMTAALLAGNAVIVKMPSAETPEAEAVCACLRNVIMGTEFEKRIVLLRCGHEKETVDALTSLCDVRVIWGGDASVEAIRRSPLPPRATDIPFADRQSMAAFDAKAILAEDDLTDVIRAFYNDTLLNDQNACSSPRIVYWLGDEASVSSAREKFWAGFGKYAGEKYPVLPASATGKLTSAAVLASSVDGARIEKGDNRVVRVFVPEITGREWQYTAPGGLFIESTGKPEAILPLLGEKCQTVAFYGDVGERIRELVLSSGVKGADRIVPVGHTLDFTLVWDGHDLIGEMSRKIVL